MHISSDDLRIDMYSNAMGPQDMRITHLPTGTVVSEKLRPGQAIHVVRALLMSRLRQQLHDKSDKRAMDRQRTITLDLTQDPFGWVQWKGTQVCMDVHCKRCGHMTHIDADFAYYIKCGRCGQVYELNGHIELIPLDFEPENTKKTTTGDD